MSSERAQHVAVEQSPVSAPRVEKQKLADFDEESTYLAAVREFADNVLKYGTGIYSPRHTPLFLDCLSIDAHEPVKYIWRKK